MKKNILKENVFGPEQKHELAKILGKEKLEQIRAYNWHYLVYLDDDTNMQVIIHHCANSRSSFNNTNSSFFSLLEQGKLSGLSNIIMACTFYPVLFRNELLSGNTIFKNSQLPKMISDILWFGNGYLAYYHQLENIYSLLTNGSHAECYSFRRDWNLKKDYTRDVASKINISNNYTLLDLILDRTIGPDLFVYQGNFHGAYTLTNYLEKR